MEDQPNKTKKVSRRRSRQITVFSGFIVLAVAIVLVTIVAFKAGKNSVQQRVAVVNITKSGFQPATLSVKSGTKIIWTNDDNGMHQVVANPFPTGTDLRGLKSEILNNSQTYVYTAKTVGSFGYHDQLHPTINGTLVVKK